MTVTMTRAGRPTTCAGGSATRSAAVGGDAALFLAGPRSAQRGSRQVRGHHVRDARRIAAIRPSTSTPGPATSPPRTATPIYMWSYTATGGALPASGADAVRRIRRHGDGDPPQLAARGRRRSSSPGRPASRRTASPTQPQFTNGVLTSLVDAAPKTNGTITYQFTAGAPGTYLYSSGTDVLKQKEMGLYGALIVRPVGRWRARQPRRRGADRRSPSTPRTEYLYVLERDRPGPALGRRAQQEVQLQHQQGALLLHQRAQHAGHARAQQRGVAAEPAVRRARATSTRPRRGRRTAGLIRYVNAGTSNYPFHPHGSSQRVIVRDGRPVTDGASQRRQLPEVPRRRRARPERSTRSRAGRRSTTPATTRSRPTSSCRRCRTRSSAAGTETWFSENPYLGRATGPDPRTAWPQNNQCGEYYHVAHSHAL